MLKVMQNYNIQKGEIEMSVTKIYNGLGNLVSSKVMVICALIGLCTRSMKSTTRMRSGQPSGEPLTPCCF